MTDLLIGIGRAATGVMAAAILVYAAMSIVGSEERAIYESADKSPYVTDPSPFDGQLTALDVEALDHAYKQYRIKLFEGWMNDPTKQPERAMFGAEKARPSTSGS